MMQAIKENWWHTPDLAWRGAGGYCVTYEGKTTGYFVYPLLEEYNTATGVATGNTKPNDPGEPEYISPFYNVSLCPLPPVEPEPEPVLGWRGLNLYCLKQSGKNTGFYGYTHLEQYDESTGMATGVTKANSSGDPDYIAPVKNEGLCPIPAPEPVLGWRPISPYCIVETDPGYSTCQGIDLSIILDITGSMNNSLTNIRQSLFSIMTSISNKYGDYRMNIVFVSDDYSSGIGNTYYEIPVDFSLGNQAEVQQALNNISVRDGANTPEPHDLALQSILNGLGGSFRDKVTKAIFIITDASNSGYDDAHGGTDITFAQSLSQRAKDNGIMVFPIIVGNDSKALACGNAYVGTTGGRLYTSSNGNVDTQIIDALGDVMCVVEPPKSGKTGYQGYQSLQQYNVDTGFSTGITKTNSPSDPDYFYPIYNPGECLKFTISPIEHYGTEDFGSFYITVSSGIPWSIISKPSWIMVSQSSGSGDAQIYVNYSISKNGTRSGFITFSSAGIIVTCKVTQGGDILEF